MKYENLFFSCPLLRLTSYLICSVIEVYFFYYTTILTSESISYFVHCCEQILDKQQMKGRKKGFILLTVPGVKPVVTGKTGLQKQRDVLFLTSLFCGKQRIKSIDVITQT